VSVPQQHEIEVGSGGEARPIAVLHRDGRTPAVLWLGGYYSDMTGTKAEALDQWGAEAGHAVVRFDYSGHGASGGTFTDGTIGRWLAEAEAVTERFAPGPVVLTGSSMGGWIAMLLALRMKAAGAPAAGLVLIAPAIDMTERLMWDEFPEEVRREIMEKGVWQRPSEYDSGGYPITRGLIEDGRNHLLFDRPSLEPGCPVHILHGRQDPDVPLAVSLDLVSMLHADDVTLSIIQDGDHRLSRPQDITLLQRVVGAMAAGDQPPSPAA
jgi:pimeloyl-ACP methyl ester carboxylesterase